MVFLSRILTGKNNLFSIGGRVRLPHHTLIEDKKTIALS